MGFRLTVLLAAAIFLAMYFSPDPEPRVVAEREPAPVAPEPAPPAVERTVRAPEPVRPAAVPDPAPAPVVPPRTAPVETVSAEPEAAPPSDGDIATASDEISPRLPGLGLEALSADSSAAALGLAEAVRLRAAAPAPTATEGPSAVRGEPVAPPAPPLRRAEVLGTNVNLRAGPSTGNPVVGRVSFGDRVDVMELDPVPGWMGIRHPETGRTVYMASRFLQLLP